MVGMALMDWGGVGVGGGCGWRCGRNDKRVGVLYWWLRVRVRVSVRVTVGVRVRVRVGARTTSGVSRGHIWFARGLSTRRVAG